MAAPDAGMDPPAAPGAGGDAGPAATGSYYRRPLPEGQIAFASPEGKRLFREALAAGHMEGWFALAEQFHTQADPAFCGLGTLVVVLNALEIDPGRIWKGPWRWYGEDLLDCCLPLDQVQQKGITIDELACLARCNGATATTVRADSGDVDALRAAIRAATAAARGPVLVAGYARSALGQTGSGHFSPIAGYHPERDLALILDVARFKYPPHWVPLPLLWRAMTGQDPATGKARGWIVLDRGAQRALPLYFHLSAGDGLAELVGSLLEEAPALLAGVAADRPEGLVAGWVAAVDAQLADRLRQALRPLVSPAALPPAHRTLVENILSELHATAAYRAVRQARRDPAAPAVSDEVLAMLLLALPDPVVSRLSAPAAEALAQLRTGADRGPALTDELAALRDQLTVLRQWSCAR